MPRRRKKRVRPFWDARIDVYSVFACSGVFAAALLSGYAKQSGLTQLSISLDLGLSEEPWLDDAMVLGHTICMSLAWLFCFPMAIMCSRYFRACFSERNTWYKYHVFWNSVGAVLVIVGVILICCRNRDNKPKAKLGTTKDVLGITTACFSLVNVLLSYFRPVNAKSGKRSIWQILHSTTGVTAFLVAMVTICFGYAVVGKLGLIAIPISVAFVFLGLEIVGWSCANYRTRGKPAKPPTYPNRPSVSESTGDDGGGGDKVRRTVMGKYRFKILFCVTYFVFCQVSYCLLIFSIDF